MGQRRLTAAIEAMIGGLQATEGKNLDTPMGEIKEITIELFLVAAEIQAIVDKGKEEDENG